MTATERTAWLESRRNGVGSSDVAKILGLSPWGTALDVYASKVDLCGDEAMTPPQEWGIRLEAPIAGAVMDHYGWTLEKVPTVRHRDHDFLIASADRVNQDREVVEIKTSRVGQGWGDPETADVPEHYWVQVQHQLEVLEVDVAWVFVLVGGSDFRRYRVPRDRQYLDTVFDPLREFWDRVERREPPDPDWSHPTTIAALNRLYVPQAGRSIDLDGECAVLADEYESLGQEIKFMEEARDGVKARLIHAVGEAERGILPDGRVVSRKQITVKCKAKEACESVQTRFSILKSKG